MVNNKIKVGMVGISFGMEFIPIYMKHPDVYEIADNFKDLDNLKIENFGTETTEEWAKFVIFWI